MTTEMFVTWSVMYDDTAFFCRSCFRIANQYYFTTALLQEAQLSQRRCKAMLHITEYLPSHSTSLKIFAVMSLSRACVCPC